MNRNWTVAGSLALGAGLMYALDPQQGRRRRARCEDQLTHAGRALAHTLGLTWRDARHRLTGLACETRARLHDESVADAILVQRARARLGHVCAHPHAVTIEAQNGRLILRGTVLPMERDRVVAAMGRVRGAKLVEDCLSEQSRADGPERGRFIRTGENWPPSWRFALGLSGAGLAVLGLFRPRSPWLLTGALGAGLMTRGFTNQPIRRITGVGAGRRAVDIEKIVNIAASVDKVYGYWSQLTNFPKFMSHVRSIQDRGDGRYHWVVDGPAGFPVGWDARITKLVPGELLAWKSEPGASIENTGLVMFRPNDDGGTRVHVRMSYNPVAGILGHSVARLFGVDPKRQIDQDLARLKSFLETGTLPHDAHDRPAKGALFH